MATIIYTAYTAVPSDGGRFQVVFDIGGRNPPALAPRTVDVKNTAQALAAMATYEADAKATGKPLAVSMRVAKGSRSPNGFDAANAKFYRAVNLDAPKAPEPVNLLRLTSSPWGVPQHITQLADGIVMIDTASHGGIKVSDERYAQMPEAFRETPYSKGGWFEEDCDWAFVAVTFPDAFKDEHVAIARKTIASTYPELVQHIPGGAA